MRAVFIGASSTTQATAAMLLQRGHEVVVIECDKEKIDRVSETLDCGFLHGDGSRPAVLREADPEHTERLFCLTDNDQSNILASLVGRTLGFKHVVCKIQDAELIHLGVELGLEDLIVPSQTIGRTLAEMFDGRAAGDVSAQIRGDARLFSFVVRPDDAGPLQDLALSSHARVVCLYRAERFALPQDETVLEVGDEVVLVTDARDLDKLQARWGTTPADRG
jgi:trk system potassium uptake protein